MKITCAVSNFSDTAKTILEEFYEVNVINCDQQSLALRSRDSDVVFVQLGVRIDRALLDSSENLKVIATATTGLDHIDVDYAEKKGIHILSLKEERNFLDTITGTAEHAWGLLSNLMRHTIPATESVRQGQWKRESFRGHTVRGKTLGIVGLGRLGKMMARFGNAFDMQVIACDPYIDEHTFRTAGVRNVSMDELLENSDVISLHIHLSEETEDLISKRELQMMKPHAYLINTARGKIVHEQDVLEALRQGYIAGYATDVLDGELNFEEEGIEHPLIQYSRHHPNCIITPHIGGTTHESREATDIFMAEKIKRYFQDLPGHS